jgi:DNA-binding Lrp family transcriptional regulator
MVKKMDEIDRKLLAGIGKGISLTNEPFNEIALQVGITPKEVVTRLSNLKENGVIRRFGASIKPKNVGFLANALVAWKVPENRIQEIGIYLSKYPEISHCYERKTVNGRWEYNIYTVIHGREREAVQRIVMEISKLIAVNEYKMLYSTRDLKRNVSSGDSDMVARKGSSILPFYLREMNDP